MVMQNSTTSITVALESEDGRAIYASTGFASNSTSWQKMNATLRANGTDHAARLALWLEVCKLFTSTSQDQTLPQILTELLIADPSAVGLILLAITRKSVCERVSDKALPVMQYCRTVAHFRNFCALALHLPDACWVRQVDWTP